MYYNTTTLTGIDLKKEVKNARSQDKIILAFFKTNSPLSPSQVYRNRFHIGLGDVPITSIRRSITNLTNDGYLIKTGIQREGIYGKFENVWKLTSSQFRLL
jgi:hypothetical protein